MSGIRSVTVADLPVMAKLHAASFSEAWGETALGDLLATPGAMGLIAEPKLGFILIRTATDEAEILTLCVAEPARRSGLGRALLQAGATNAQDAGAKSMFLEVAADNEPAKALYNRHGFRIVGTRHAYYQGTDALVMRADLPLALADAGKTL